ncbi:MAG: hypothetical protein JWM10_1496 [Myxococcaceae bacterium]|nr:hypothetical protein [Myxococcaceae bacterium]
MTRPKALEPTFVRTSALEPALLEEIWEFYRQFVRRDKDAFLDAVRQTDEVIYARARVGGPLLAFIAVKLVEIDWEGQTHGVIYNVWSAIDGNHRGTNLMQRVGFRVFLRYRLRHPLRPVHFMMTSSTYKSYLLMARNYSEYWPNRRAPTPPRERAMMDSAVAAAGLSSWDPERGVLERFGALRYLEGVVADDGEQGDPDIAFYARANPGQPEGDSLGCLAPLSLNNWAYMAYRGVRRTLRPRRAVKTA